MILPSWIFSLERNKINSKSFLFNLWFFYFSLNFIYFLIKVLVTLFPILSETESFTIVPLYCELLNLDIFAVLESLLLISWFLCWVYFVWLETNCWACQNSLLRLPIILRRRLNLIQFPKKNAFGHFFPFRNALEFLLYIFEFPEHLFLPGWLQISLNFSLGSILVAKSSWVRVSILIALLLFVCGDLGLRESSSSSSHSFTFVTHFNIKLIYTNNKMK